MKEKINISEILKDKKNGLRLYSPIFGECAFCSVRKDTNDICVKKHNGMKEFFDSKGLYYNTGEVMLFPSKSMRDWEKLSWKRGDLLINSCGLQCIFKEWASDDYTKFNGCYSNSRDGYEDVSNAETDKFVKLDNNTSYGYIRELEKRCGGVLNIKTLKIEKQPEFKDGDIITFKDRIIIIYNTYIEKSPERTEIYFHACLKEGVLTVNEYLMSCGFGEGWYSSTEEEKHNLFEALAKKCKRWDSEKKQIVDFKPNDEIKPFDKVLVRDGKDEIWEPAFFFRNLSQFCEYNYQTVGGEWRVYCIPYIGNESLLGTTKDVEG